MDHDDLYHSTSLATTGLGDMKTMANRMVCHSEEEFT